MLQFDALLRYSFFYRGNSDYRLPEFQCLFLQHCLLLIGGFFSAPLAKQKEARYNMTEQTKTVIFEGAQIWLLPITRLSNSARRC